MTNYGTRFWLTLVLTGILALGACDSTPEETSAQAPSGARGFAGGAQAAETETGKRTAVIHSFRLQLPNDAVETVQKSHVAACVRLGCTILNTRLDRSSEQRVSASISLRIVPAAFAEFATLIAAPPSKVVVHTETTEDKTVAMLDIEKRLAIKIALRDRLAAMLKDPTPKTPAELIAIERELASVQGDIESNTAQYDYLRTITETMKVDISYAGTMTQVGGIDFSPIERALDRIGSTMVSSTAFLISFIAGIVPWLPLIVFFGWLIRRGIRRWRARKAAA